MRLLAISGSLQRASSNTALLARAAALVSLPDELHVHEPLDALPYFTPDHDVDAPPPAVEHLRAAIGAADAVVIATPEYAGGMPGSLKNALDWLVGSGELYGKRIAIMSAAPSEDRGQHARASVELTVTMQGARVCDSFTVAVARGASDDELTALAENVVARVQRSLTAASCAS